MTSSHQLALYDTPVKSMVEYRVAVIRGNPPRRVTYHFGSSDKAHQRALDHIAAISNDWTVQDAFIETRHTTKWVRT